MNSSEIIENVPLVKLKPFPNHPFQVRDDAPMKQLIESIRQVGVLVPIIVRCTEDQSYEIISGHRRTKACEELNLRTIPAIIRNVDAPDAIIMMVDSNFQRETILPSEKARAYKMKLDALKRQGARNDLTSAQHGQRLEKKTTRDLIAVESPDSSSQIQRYVRLNELIPELLEMVDLGRIALTPAVELSYLTDEEQIQVLITIESEQVTPSLSQAQRMRKLSNKGTLSDDTDALPAGATVSGYTGKSGDTLRICVPLENENISFNLSAVGKDNRTPASLIFYKPDKTNEQRLLG